MAFLTASHVTFMSGINLQSFVRTAAAAILILCKPEVTGYNDEYGPLYQKLNRLPGFRHSSSDDLIEVTRSACLTSDDLDCPEFKDTDDLLVPTTRSRSLTDDDVRRRMWSSSPKIKMNKGPDVYESSGRSMTAEEETTPCSSDDEDCLTFSGADELFFPTSEATAVAPAVDTTPTTGHTSQTTALAATSTKALLASEAAIVDLPTEEKNLRLSSKVFIPQRQVPTPNTSLSQSRSDVNHLGANRNQLHDVNNYYGGSVGRSLEKLTINIGLILGIAFGIAVLLLVLAFALFKYRNQFGNGAIGEKLVDYQTSKNVPLVFEPCKIQAQNTGSRTLQQPLKVDVSLNLTQQQQQQQQHPHNLQSSSTPRKKDVKEWYV